MFPRADSVVLGATVAGERDGNCDAAMRSVDVTVTLRQAPAGRSW
ncbi:hypothetical protein ACFPK5_39715 [Streptomyces beijiangensis]